MYILSTHIVDVNVCVCVCVSFKDHISFSTNFSCVFPQVYELRPYIETGSRVF